MKSNLITIQSHSTEGVTVSLETMETFTSILESLHAQ